MKGRRAPRLRSFRVWSSFTFTFTFQWISVLMTGGYHVDSSGTYRCCTHLCLLFVVNSSLCCRLVVAGGSSSTCGAESTKSARRRLSHSVPSRAPCSTIAEVDHTAERSETDRCSHSFHSLTPATPTRCAVDKGQWVQTVLELALYNYLIMQNNRDSFGWQSNWSMTQLIWPMIHDRWQQPSHVQQKVSHSERSQKWRP